MDRAVHPKPRDALCHAACRPSCTRQPLPLPMDGGGPARPRTLVHGNKKRPAAPPPTPQTGPRRGPPGQVPTGDLENLLIGREGQQRLGKLSQEGLQDHSRDVDVPIVVKVHGLPWTQNVASLSPDGAMESRFMMGPGANGFSTPEGETSRQA